MRDKLRYAYIAGAAIVIIGAVLLFRGGDAATQSAKKLGPEGVLKEFTEAMKNGKFDSAMALCDTASMKDHMEAFQQKWEDLSRKDSAAFVSTMSILADTEVHFAGMIEEDGVCTVDYVLEMDGTRKAHQATLRKEAGEWKVAEITDRP